MGKGAETRARILERAVGRAARDGLVGLSIGALAEEMGVSKSGLWAHFGSKEELQTEILRVAAEAFEESVLKPALKAPRGVPRLRKLFEGWMGWINHPGHPGGCVFMAAGAELDDQEVGRPRDMLVGLQRQLDQTVARVARAGVAEGQLRPDLDCDQLAFEVHGIVYAYAHARRLLQDPAAEKRARAALERLLADARNPE